MRWRGRRQSRNVDDRRGRGRGLRLPRRGRVRLPRGRAGKVSGSSILIFIVVALGLWIFAGINPLQLISILDGSGGTVSAPQEARTPVNPEVSDERAQFLAVVLAETEDTWGRIFERSGENYDPPTLTLYTGFTETACGFGNATAGPFYCPRDARIYIDTSFFDTLANRFGAPGDFAQAYVLAHEVGHHVQNLTGILGRYHRERQQMGERRANLESIRIELQADCYAGVWAHSAARIGITEEGDIEEALDAAAAVGDDTIQRRTRGTVVPESFNHGTADQRSRWFRVGYQSGNAGACDTFSAPSL